jgi:hypothetical protein
MEDLKPIYKKQKTASELVEKAWAESAKNEVARNYIAGMVDGLRFANAVSLLEYTRLCDQYQLS